MYNTFFGLERSPFSMAPDPNCVYLTAQHREAISGLVYAIVDRKGYMVLTGEVGTGKTTALASALRCISPDRVQTSVILNPTLTPSEFLESVMLDFGISEIATSKALRLKQLQDFLLEGHRQGKISALVIDEAHKLSLEILEEIRLLGNFDFAGQRLLQIILVGQNELADLLDLVELRQLKQRVAVRLTIQPLSALDTTHYIRFRWAKAGTAGEPPFTENALRLIGRFTGGIPRVINTVCDNALLLAFADGSSEVSEHHVFEAFADLHLITPVEAAREKVRMEAASAAVPEPIGQEEQADVNSEETPVAPGYRLPMPAPPDPSLSLKTLEKYSQPSLLARWFGKRQAMRAARTEQPA